jgi:hypothetical protein
MAPLGNFSFDEDDMLEIPISHLRQQVIDVDDDTTALQFWAVGGTHVHVVWEEASDRFQLTADANWNGNENIVFTVVDTAGAVDTDTSAVTVLSVPDPPGPFSLDESLIFREYDDWPGSLDFQWHEAVDPDEGDFVYYRWHWRLEGGSGASEITRTVADTTLVFEPDTTAEYGSYIWWVTATDPSDSTSESNFGVVEVGVISDVTIPAEVVPEAFRLLPNSPNPFNPETVIDYHLPEAVDVRLAVFDTRGRLIRLLAEGAKKAGVHSAVWDGRDATGRKVSTGLYFYRLRAGSRVFHRKMLLIQ